MAHASSKVCEPTSTPARRSGNYKPCVWSIDYLLSLKTDHLNEVHTKRAEKLKGEVRTMLLGNNMPETEDSPSWLSKLELIDDLERLGLSYNFKEEINNVLHNIYHKNNTTQDLHATALAFRIFRKHGYHVPQEVFDKFKDEHTSIFKGCHCDDIKGLLSMYEASYLCTEGESIMDEAREFASKQLKNLMIIAKNMELPLEKSLVVLVNQALVFPLHWRPDRIEARWFIDVYKMRSDMNPVLLELAKLDYNIVQALFQDELKDMARWYKDTRLGEKMGFARDSMVVSFSWAASLSFEPQYEYCRRMLKKTFQFITIIDDMYDIYGTLDELELFTNIIERWDINAAMTQLPDYMKICFLALSNNVHEMAYSIFVKHGFDALSSLKKGYVDLCKVYLTEAKWYHTGYKPTLEEYLKVASYSTAFCVTVTQGYLFMQKSISEMEVKCLEENSPNLMRWCTTVGRIADDLSTSSGEMKRGDTPKSIQCYMYDMGVLEEVARDHMNTLMLEGWKKVNKYRVEKNPLSQISIDINMGMLRWAQFIYHYEDGHGTTKAQLLGMILEPIPLEYANQGLGVKYSKCLEAHGMVS